LDSTAEDDPHPRVNKRGPLLEGPIGTHSPGAGTHVIEKLLQVILDLEALPGGVAEDFTRAQPNRTISGRGVYQELRMHAGVSPRVHAQELRPEISVNRLTRVDPLFGGLLDQGPLLPKPLYRLEVGL
jgi:hypothetical protein